ncbi:hypothetical protein CEV34_0804 [Brucella pseudogrignonensis]|jgi:hypothetical protein|uniref:Uncharacterized protein n=1 Tax=Brucella pseudogrignonensis TaxID=419475 RepID=A0A256GPY0_9HYPH|nr:hypothetical protein CEV34_0804 [Brucella pseudogrignonensis]
MISGHEETRNGEVMAARNARCEDVALHLAVIGQNLNKPGV